MVETATKNEKRASAGPSCEECGSLKWNSEFFDSVKELKGKKWTELNESEKIEIEGQLRATKIYMMLLPDGTPHKCPYKSFKTTVLEGIRSLTTKANDLTTDVAKIKALLMEYMKNHP